jgi:hypothetical protein
MGKFEEGSDGSPKKLIDIAFDVKFNSGYTSNKNVFSAGDKSPNTSTTFKDGTAIPLHTRMITTYGKKEPFDQKYLEP